MEITLTTQKNATLWYYSASHCRVVIKVTLANDDVVYLNAYGCRLLALPTTWNNPDIRCQDDRDGMTAIVDSEANARIECSFVEMLSDFDLLKEIEYLS